jgi:hypothetical protein
MKIKCKACGKLFVTLPDWKQHSRDIHCSCADFDLEAEAEEGDHIPSVEPTPRLPDECKKLLDNNWNILLFRNTFGSYSACAFRDGETIEDAMEKESQLTDDFEPSSALYRLTEKMFGNIA